MIADAIILLYSASLKMQAERAYFSFAEIVVWRAVQATWGEALPSLILDAHSTAFLRNSSTILLRFPEGAM